MTAMQTRNQLAEVFGTDPHGPIPWPPRRLGSGRYEVRCEADTCGVIEEVPDLAAARQFLNGHLAAARLVAEVAGGDLL